MLLSLHEKWHATFLENWPDELHDFGQSRVSIDIPPDVMDWMIAHASHLSHQGPRDAPPFPVRFRKDLEGVLQEVGAPAFIRTGVCSFKQPDRPIEPVQDVDDIVALLGERNLQLASTLHDCQMLDYPLTLWLSPWRDVPPWTEFRVFIKERKVIGVSQYHHHQTYPQIVEQHVAIKSGIARFLTRLVPKLHLDDVVVDVDVQPDGQGAFKATLIEINPFILRTDPCMFRWENGGDFDRQFRYRGV